MEATGKVEILSGKEFEHLMPKPQFKEITIKRNADVLDTVWFVQKLVHDTKWQTVKLAKALKKATLYDTCKAIWNFTKHIIRYQKDKDGVEQCKDPARTFADRSGDCDDMTTFNSSLLANVFQTDKIILRIAKYKNRSYYQHIYPVIPTPQGEIIMDCVVNKFNYEEPYTAKKDTIMDLNYLNGISDNDAIANINADELHGADQQLDTQGLGISFKSLQRGLKKISINNVKKGLKKIQLKKVLHALNRFNPATALLRLGFLACMKLNLFGVARNLRWSYLSDEDAKKKGANMGKFAQYKRTRTKSEEIFYGAGGKPENMKKAILNGKGNRDRQVVAGLDGFDDDAILGYSENTPLETLLGAELQESEAQNGLGSLGEIATGTAIAAASGAIATIAKIIQGIGPLFGGKGGDDTGQAGEGQGTSVQEASQANLDVGTDATPREQPDVEQNGLTAFWEKNKTWAMPTAIGLGVLTIAALAYKASNNSSQGQTTAGLDGIEELPAPETNSKQPITFIPLK